MQSDDPKKGNVVDFTAHKEAEALEEQRKLCLGCGGCGGQAFYLLKSGEAECVNCRGIAGGINIMNVNDIH